MRTGLLKNDIQAHANNLDIVYLNVTHIAIYTHVDMENMRKDIK